MPIKSIRHITLPSGDTVSAMGQGTWFMGENPNTAAQEISALQFGIDRGLTLIDTAEMYADGGAELIVGQAIAQRERCELFLVSKVLPHHADIVGTQAACEASLRRLNTDYLDLYLLHWPGDIPIEETIDAMESLVEQGKIRQWGVSNFDINALQSLSCQIDLDHISTNQVLYNLIRRGIEFDLLPWMQENAIPMMAYSPIEQGRLLENPMLAQVAQRHAATPAQIALAWVMRHPDVIAIPKSASTEHIQQNVESLNIYLMPEDLAILDRAFAPPVKKQPLEML